MNTSTFFNKIFDTVRSNGIIVLNDKGVILSINPAFTIRFGYCMEDLAGKYFSILFTEKDKAIFKPEAEIQQVLNEGSAADENYLVNKDGNKIWVAGESVLIQDNLEKYIVKIVHNIHAQKQLERFLIQSHEFIETIFDSITESALLMLDSSIRIIKVNDAFLKLFGLDKAPVAGSRLSEIDNDFWLRPDIKQQVVNFLVQNSGEVKTFYMETKSGGNIKLNLQGKLIEGLPGTERKLLVIIKRSI